MFNLVPYTRRKDDVFNQFARSLNNALTDEFYAPFKASAAAIRTDIRETDNSYLIEAELPGFQKEDITVEYEKPYLTIKAVRKEEKAEEGGNQQVLRRERRYGEYVRRIAIENIQSDDIQATLKQGILTLELPKQEKRQPSRIEIQAADE